MNHLISIFVCLTATKAFGEEVIDVIHLPYIQDQHWHSKASLSVDIDNLTDISVCFAVMVDAFLDVKGDVEQTILEAIFRTIFVGFNIVYFDQHQIFSHHQHASMKDVHVFQAAA